MLPFPFNRFPYTDFNKINLDWIFRELRRITSRFDEAKESADRAEAAVNQAASSATQAASSATQAGNSATQAASSATQAASSATQAASSASQAAGSVQQVLNGTANYLVNHLLIKVISLTLTSNDYTVERGYYKQFTAASIGWPSTDIYLGVADIAFADNTNNASTRTYNLSVDSYGIYTANSAISWGFINASPRSYDASRTYRVDISVLYLKL